MSLTFLILLLDALEIGYHTFATIMFALTILLPCQPGLISSIACSNDHIFYTGNCLRLIFAALEFFILMQVTVRATFYVVLVLLTDFIFLWIECGIFISNNVSSKIYQIEYRKITLRLVLFTCCVTPSVKLFILRNNICAPPYFGSIFLDKCTRSEVNSTPGMLSKFLVYFIEWFIPVQCLWSAMFYFIQVYYGGLTYLLDYLNVLNATWSTLSPRAILDFYKQTKLLEIKLNHCVGRIIVPVSLVGFPSVQILAFFTMIRLYEDIPMPAFLYFPRMYMDMLLLNVILQTLAANLSIKSDRLRTKFLTEGHTWRKVNRKELQATNSMSLKVGSNYIAAGTPLVIQDFCVNQTVSLLLMTR
ncbi:hypothetical protein Fcan01_25773 [Folsomia candida]|uniref:Uncharacterized protein n=1 Tax=Folsomia candida TaxID=158441 RepID=A0A226D469_FOLCA|nr:hypothetical protein Fcan01_25773 [Folsomia candida]